MCAQNIKVAGHNIYCLPYCHSSLELRAPLPRSGLWGGAGSARTRLGAGVGAEAAGGAQRYRETTNAAQGPNFGLTRFRACTAKFSAITGPTLAAVVATRRGAGPFCGHSRGQQGDPARSQRDAPVRPEKAGAELSRGTANLTFRSYLSDSSLFLEGFFTACPCRPARPGSVLQTSGEVTSLRNAVIGLLVMQKHYLLVTCNTVLKDS